MFRESVVNGVTNIRVPAGIHHLSEPVVIRGSHIRITGEDGAILRGTVRLSPGAFREESPGVWCADVPQRADGFYIGQRKYTMARYPKADRPGDIYDGYSANCIFPEKTSQWQDPAGGYIHAMHQHMWGGYSYRIEGKNPDGTLALSGGWQNNRQMGMHEEYRYAENIREEMTQPGEWYFDEKKSRVYVRPVPGDDLEEAEIAVSTGFFILEDCRDVTVENISFQRSVRTFMDTREPLLRSDWTIYRGGAILVKNSARCTLDRCSFLDIGSNGVFVDGKNEDISVVRCHFRRIGGSGICFVGRPESVRSPLFEYNEVQSFASLDLEKGPKADCYPKNCTVEDCLVEYVGTVEKQASGIEVSMAYGICMKNSTVCHTSRAGINISEGTFGGHRIEGCDVFDTVRETGDHGSFNSWGRDRYWHVPDLDDREAGKYARLDMLGPNVITRSRFRCDRGWDIDLDDGSSDFIITENLCLNGGIKLREGFFRTVRGNITVNNTLHFHAWYPESGDVAENNILFIPYSTYAMPEHWGERIDNNICYAPGISEPEKAAELGAVSNQDGNSLRMDPKFRAPWQYDFRPTNPLIKGFEDFPTQFGVRYAPLKALADVPELTWEQPVHQQQESPRVKILGMTLKNIDSDGEMSVYATAGHTGALVMELEEGGEARKRGICLHDVIVGWGDTRIRTAQDLLDAQFISDTPIYVLRKQCRQVL